MAKKKQIKIEEKAVLEIIRKYGNNIDLKKSPYLIAEIVRQYGSVFNPIAGGETGPTPGSHGTPPPPSPQNMIDPSKKINELILEVSKLSAKLKQMNTKVNRLGK